MSAGMAADRARPSRTPVTPGWSSYSRPGCHLCAQAVEIVAATCAEVGAE